MPQIFASGDLIADRYRVSALLGAGGQGAVYHAFDEQEAGKEVALKVVEFQIHETTKVSRIASEYATLEKISHPSIIAVHSAGRLAENQCYIAMEFVKGGTLEARIDKQVAAIEFKECLRILRQVALGLEAAHNAKVIHRDLKPANILLTEEGGVKIIDFGLARDLEHGQTLTQEGLPIGTLAYMSPEQILRKQKLDHRVDIYAFGIIAFEILVGRPPFTGESHYAVAAQHLNETNRIPSIAETVPSVPKWYQRFVELCTEYERDRRFQTFDEVIQTLEEKMLLAGMTVPDARVKLSFAGKLLDALFGSI